MNFLIRRVAQASAVVSGLLLISFCPAADVKTAPMRYQVTGLFAPEREQDLREAFEMASHVKLVNVDYKNAEVELEFVPANAFPGAKPDQVIERLDNLLKSVSNHTFGIKAPRQVPREKLKLIEIPVAGLDCKGCCLAAYEAVSKLDGVEQATASFREGLVTALVDPSKIDRAALEAALKKREVHLKK